MSPIGQDKLSIILLRLSQRRHTLCRWFRRHGIVNSLANPFQVTAKALAAWCDSVLKSNLSYFRVRRDLLAAFNRLFAEVRAPSMDIDEESLIVVRQFLMSRNDAIGNDQRLAFDKTVLSLYAKASKLGHEEQEDQ